LPHRHRSRFVIDKCTDRGHGWRTPELSTHRPAATEPWGRRRTPAGTNRQPARDTAGGLW